MMAALESVALTLGTLVVKNATKLWFGDRDLAADVAASAVDALTTRLRGEIDRRKLRDLFSGMEIKVAERIRPMLEQEFGSMDEKEAAIAAVTDTFERAVLTDDDLFQHDVNPGRIHRYLCDQVPEIPTEYRLSDAGTAFYHRLLRECCACIVQARTKLAGFQTDALVEVLRRQHQILDDLERMLSTLRVRDSADDAGAEYLDHVRTVLDRVQFFGARVSQASKRYPLSMAYLSLTLAHAHQPSSDWSMRAENVLGQGSRFLVRGEAGSGKTTLLQWIAVRCASSSLPGAMGDWTGVVPFFVPLRRYAGRALPMPPQFVDEISPHLVDDLPGDWVKSRLEKGAAAVLIDGVDELPESQRQKVWDWLFRLSEWYPNARYVVTSRPAAAESDWLASLGFQTAEVRPMSPSESLEFIARWHNAMREDCVDKEEIASLHRHQSELVDTLAANRDLRRLAASPLLCALLCALKRDNSELPTSRMKLYDTALDMLLEQRDRERDWNDGDALPAPEGLRSTEQRLLLQRLAYWMVSNKHTDVELDRAVQQIGKSLAGLAQVRASAEEVMHHLLERSGLLREPVVGRIDFIHRTFQDYLAARAAVDADDIGNLVARAQDREWHDVIVMAAGHATSRQRHELIKRLLNAKVSERRQLTYNALLALACLDTAPEVDPKQRELVQSRARDLVPPKDLDVAEAIAAGGELTLDLLAGSELPLHGPMAVPTLWAVVKIGGEEAFPVMARFARSDEPDIHEELVRAWRYFPAVSYARHVLSQMPGHTGLSVRLGDSAESLQLPARAISGLDRLPEPTEVIVGGGGSGPAEIDLSALPLIPALSRLVVDVPSTGWPALARNPSLREVHLRAGNRTEVGAFGSLPNVETLGFAEVGFDHRMLPNLTVPPRLRDLQLVRCEGVPDLLTELARRSTPISRLVLDGCDIEDNSPIELPDGLRSLVLANCSSDPLSLVVMPPELAELFIERCPRVQLTSLRRLASVRVVLGPGQAAAGSYGLDVTSERRHWPFRRDSDDRTAYESHRDEEFSPWSAIGERPGPRGQEGTP